MQGVLKEAEKKTQRLEQQVGSQGIQSSAADKTYSPPLSVKKKTPSPSSYDDGRRAHIAPASPRVASPRNDNAINASRLDISALEGQGQIEFCVSCSNLIQMDWISRSDPIVTLEIRDFTDINTVEDPESRSVCVGG